MTHYLWICGKFQEGQGGMDLRVYTEQRGHYPDNYNILNAQNMARAIKNLANDLKDVPYRESSRKSDEKQKVLEPRKMDPKWMDGC